jgi:photosystem II stability/assembly factor-like uncharacterized protein
MSNEKDGLAIAVTHDGGESWNRLPVLSALLNDEIIGTMFFLDAGQGWLLLGGQPGAGSQSKELFGTSDGGNTWTHLSGSLEVSASSTPELQLDGLHRPGYLGALSFTSTNDGWIALQRLGLLHSTDDGRTWRMTDVGAESRLSPLRFIDIEHGWVMDNLNLWITSDGGDTWTQLPLPTLTQ